MKLIPDYIPDMLASMVESILIESEMDDENDVPIVLL